MAGTSTPNSMRPLGRINGVLVVILVDLCSTHNSMDSIVTLSSYVSKRAKINSDTIPKLTVKIANEGSEKLRIL